MIPLDIVVAFLVAIVWLVSLSCVCSRAADD